MADSHKFNEAVITPDRFNVCSVLRTGSEDFYFGGIEYCVCH